MTGVIGAAGSYPSVDADAIGWLTEEQMIEVDRVMIEDLGIVLMQMMENAGRHLARFVFDRVLSGEARRSVTVVAGSGGNGGGGLVAARNLANFGADVEVVLSKPGDQFSGVPRHQMEIIEAMGVPIVEEPRTEPAAIIDALIGYSLKGAPRGRGLELIEMIGRRGSATVVSLDTPSGLNVTDGTAPGSVVQADATVTLALPKVGLRHAPQVGELYLADISVPAAVMAKLGATAPDFSSSSIIGVRR